MKDMSESPELSVVTLTWNSAVHIERMLDSLTADAAADGVAVEVFVVDNGSTDGTGAMVRARQGTSPTRIELIELGVNRGTTVARNIAIQKARAELVLILDSDTEIPRGTLRKLLGARARLPIAPERLAILHPRLSYPDGGFQESARRFPTLLTKLLRLSHWEEARRWDESIPAVLERRPCTVDYAISAAWLVPRAVFDRVGLLDERIFYSPEDLEFCARCWSMGLEVWYDPAIEIIHHCQRITNKRPLSALGLSHARGLVRFWRQYGFWLRRPVRASELKRALP